MPDSQQCPSPPPAAGCGTPLSVSGAGFLQVFGPVGFGDVNSGFSLGTQYNYTVTSDTSMTTESVQQNPALVALLACTTSGCSFNPDGELFVCPPGNPHLSKISPASGPAKGGNKVVISGANLGCVTGVFFGKVAAVKFSNAEALLDCGTTNQVDVTVPKGKAGSKVRVTVTTVESNFTASKSNSVTYTYH